MIHIEVLGTSKLWRCTLSCATVCEYSCFGIAFDAESGSKKEFKLQKLLVYDQCSYINTTHWRCHPGNVYGDVSRCHYDSFRWYGPRNFWMYCHLAGQKHKLDFECLVDSINFCILCTVLNFWGRQIGSFHFSIIFTFSYRVAHSGRLHGRIQLLFY